MKTVRKNNFTADGIPVMWASEYIDEFGNPTERTKITHPYNYDGFVVWRGGDNKEIENTVWSDRLRQWDYKKNEELLIKHFGNSGDYWSQREPEKIESFLSDYIGEPIKLILVMEYCNQSSGYPVWRFDYKRIKAE